MMLVVVIWMTYILYEAALYRGRHLWWSSMCKLMAGGLLVASMQQRRIVDYVDGSGVADVGSFC